MTKHIDTCVHERTHFASRNCECGPHLQDGIIGGSSGELAAGVDPFAQTV